MSLSPYPGVMRDFAPQTIASLDDLAFRVAADGVNADRAAVGGVVRRAVRLGASHVLTDLVIDPREPTVARQRAFGELLAFLRRDKPRRTSTKDAGSTDVAWPAHAA